MTIAEVKRYELNVDVSGSTDIPGQLSIAVTVCVPKSPLLDPPIVAFCWPGGGYSRGYFDMQIDGFDGYSQAEHHATHGIITVCCDHLGVGGSSEADRSQMSYENVAATNRATVDEVMRRFREGEFGVDVTKGQQPVLIGMGQSYGGLLLIVQQGRQRTFDGIVVLGYSGSGIEIPKPRQGGTSPTGGRVPPPDEMTRRENQTFFFHWEDVPEPIIAEDMKGDHPTREAPLPMWASDRRPGGRHWDPTVPGVVAHWASVIECPVFVGVGERDVCPDPWTEPAAYRRANNITLYVGPRMGHMHNFAGTRELLWEQLTSWASAVSRNLTYATGRR